MFVSRDGTVGDFKNVELCAIYKHLNENVKNRWFYAVTTFRARSEFIVTPTTTSTGTWESKT
ncbi:hypothetical protein GQX74_014902 [Glossina fuscipes]|nr:hypothetical protein GQX74_014902 [Glossina fuscipes]